MIFSKHATASRFIKIFDQIQNIPLSRFIKILPERYFCRRIALILLDIKYLIFTNHHSTHSLASV